MNEITKKLLIEGITVLATNEKVGKLIFGTYSDGTLRSVSDCCRGEYLSPKDKAKKLKKLDKKSNKKKKIK